MNIDDEVAVTPMSSAVPDATSWRRNVLYWDIQWLFAVFVIVIVIVFVIVFVTVICNLCMTFAKVSPHQLVQNLLPLCS